MDNKTANKLADEKYIDIYYKFIENLKAIRMYVDDIRKLNNTNIDMNEYIKQVDDKYLLMYNLMYRYTEIINDIVDEKNDIQDKIKQVYDETETKICNYIANKDQNTIQSLLDKCTNIFYYDSKQIKDEFIYLEDNGCVNITSSSKSATKSKRKTTSAGFGRKKIKRNRSKKHVHKKCKSLRNKK